MPKNKKPKSHLRIPTEQGAWIDKRTVVNKNHHQMAMSLLGDVQKNLIDICSAVRMHREQKWAESSVDCSFDAQLYDALDTVVDRFDKTSSKGRPARFKLKKENTQ